MLFLTLKGTKQENHNFIVVLFFFRGDGAASISHAVPDFLTSYSISAFAIHPVDGLGIATSSSQVKCLSKKANIYRGRFLFEIMITLYLIVCKVCCH